MQKDAMWTPSGQVRGRKENVSHRKMENGGLQKMEMEVLERLKMEVLQRWSDQEVVFVLHC